VLNNYPGWLADMINQYQCGFVVPPEDPSSFADALESAADNREQLLPMGKNTSKLAVEFDRSKLADKWVDWVVGGKG